MSYDNSPRHEAKMLLPLLKPPTNDSIEAVRRLIEVSPKEEQELRRERSDVAVGIIKFRRETLDYFEVLSGQKEKLTLKPKPAVEVKPRRVRPKKYDHIAIIEAIRSGKCTREIRRRFGCSRHTVKIIAAKNGITLTREDRKKLTREQAASALRALQDGTRWKEVAAQYGVGFHTLYRLRRMHGKGEAHGARPQAIA